MRFATFQGGVHPDDGKRLTKDKPVQTYLPKGELVFPLSQHIGAPAKPVVQKKDTVLMGQRIAEAAGAVSANIVSSVSGTVKAIEPRVVASGAKVDAIVIENDGKYAPAPGMGAYRDYTKLSKQEILAAIKDAGIVGLGGAGFPTHVKLAPKDPDAIEYVIVNGSECEPYLTGDFRMMVENSEQIVSGLRVMLRLFDNAKGVIAVESNKPEGIKNLQELVKKEDRIEVVVCKTKYPQGAERNLIHTVTGRKISSANLPADAHCIVDNVDTVIAIHMAVCECTPLMRRVITVSGNGITNPANYQVRIGTNFQELVEESGGLKEGVKKVVAGGPMMGMSLPSLDIPIVKTSSALVCLMRDDVERMAETQCIRCARCLRVCPENLVPVKMMEAAQKYDTAAFAALNGMECCECGCCTYACPARRPLTQAFRQMRQAVMAERKKKRG